MEDLFLLYAKKASAFNSWFENAEEDLTDPVRCNSVEEIRVSNMSCLHLVPHLLCNLYLWTQYSSCFLSYSYQDWLSGPLSSFAFF